MVCTVTDVNQTYYGDHFTIYTNVESLFCTPETSIMLYVRCTLIKNYHNGLGKVYLEAYFEEH